MSLSFQSQYTQFQNLTQDTDSDSLTFGKDNINIGQRILETELGSFYTEETFTDTTTASNQSYNLPARFVRLKQAYITVSSTRYVLEEVFDEDEWQALNIQPSSSVSDIPQKIFCRANTYEIWPTPTTTAGNTITGRYEAFSKELQYDDYTDGTISDLTNGDTTITGSSTTFTAAMVGRYFKIDNDGVWYKISSYTGATTIDLVKNYEGTTIASGSENYTIGQMPVTPADTHHVPVYFATWQYFQGFKQSTKKGAYYKTLYEQELARAKATYGRRYSSKYIPPSNIRGRKPVFNPNWYPTLS